MPAPRGLVQQVDQLLHRRGWLPRGTEGGKEGGGRLLVGVSGGADSVALLRLLHAINQSDYWNWTLVVAHIEHGIRGKASKGDAEFVRQLAGALGLECVMASLELGKGASEAEAREGRLKALTAMARRRRAVGVVMGHHADDQAETVLLRIIRGCGLDGLGGMAPVAVVGGLTIFRPLLEVPRVELLGFLEEIGQGHRHDATNNSPVYLRNRVRQELLPLLETFNPQVRAGLQRLATLAREAQTWVEREASAVALEAVVRIGTRRAAVRRALLRDKSPLIVAAVLKFAASVAGAKGAGMDFERLQEAVRLVVGKEGGKRVELGGEVEVVVRGDSAMVWRRSQKPEARSQRATSNANHRDTENAENAPRTKSGEGRG